MTLVKSQTVYHHHHSHTPLLYNPRKKPAKIYQLVLGPLSSAVGSGQVGKVLMEAPQLPQLVSLV